METADCQIDCQTDNHNSQVFILFNLRDILEVSNGNLTSDENFAFADLHWMKGSPALV